MVPIGTIASVHSKTQNPGVPAMTKPVLVTSAAGGRQGKTGRHVSEMLLKRGVPVRAFVRTIDDRANALRALGAEIFEGDFLDIRSVQRAARDTSAIYFAYPVQDGLMDATAAMAIAAREAGVSRLVNLVMQRRARWLLSHAASIGGLMILSLQTISSTTRGRLGARTYRRTAISRRHELGIEYGRDQKLRDGSCERGCHGRKRCSFDAARLGPTDY